MLILKADEMRKLDQQTIKEGRVPATTLMENAGIAAAEEIRAHFPLKQFPRVLILSGHGNNGGDGLVVARELHNVGYQVATWLIGSLDKLSATSLTKLEELQANGQKLEIIEPSQLLVTDRNFTQYDIIVDALIGIGGRGPLREPLATLVRALNESPAKRVALDIATGIDTDTGAVESVAYAADLTITFALSKRGHFLGAGYEHTGKLIIADIGIPAEFIKAVKPRLQLITRDFISAFIPTRAKQSHKGSYGHALIVGGSRDMPGAAVLAAKSALRAGAGLASLVVPESIRELVFSYLPEAILLGLAEREPGYLAAAELGRIWQDGQKSRVYTATCYGCGVGRWAEDETALSTIIGASEGPLVIDADGLNALSENLELLKERVGEIILTPHPKEMAHLLGRDVAEVNANRLSFARDLAKTWQVYVILKGAGTIIATPTGELFINSTGGPELAKGGTGDVLAGLLTGLLAQNIVVKEACCAAVYLHGLAGELARELEGEHSVLATDVIEQIGPAMKSLTI